MLFSLMQKMCNIDGVNKELENKNSCKKHSKEIYIFFPKDAMLPTRISLLCIIRLNYIQTIFNLEDNFHII